MFEFGYELQPRRMQEPDLPAVLAIERRIYPHPWREQTFLDCLHSPYECWMLEGDALTLGHAVISCAVGEAHLLNLSIDEPFQGQGLGRWFLRFLLQRGQQLQADVMFLEVRVSNSKAQKLYQSEGFSEIGVRKNYYPAGTGREDAVIMGYSY